jgi:hypothetical protein
MGHAPADSTICLYFADNADLGSSMSKYAAIDLTAMNRSRVDGKPDVIRILSERMGFVIDSITRGNPVAAKAANIDLCSRVTVSGLASGCRERISRR